MSFSKRLKRKFFLQPTLNVAKDLLGQRLVLRKENEKRLAGIITETEAYIGQNDLGCHARTGKTNRNQVMWGPPGHIYVYFTYGMHWMLNFVAEQEGFPAAVLIRGLWPVEGIDEMHRRRSIHELRNLTNGPAKLCQAFGINGSWNGEDLCSPNARLFVEKGLTISDQLITIGPRVGLDSVPEPWKSIPWRFRLDPRSLQFTKEAKK